MLYRDSDGKKKDRKTIYQDWVRHIRYSRSRRRQMEGHWRRWYNIVDDYMWGGKKLPDGNQPVQVNEMHAILTNVMPNVSFKEGKVIVRSIPNDQIEKVRAGIYEGIGRFIVRKGNMVHHFNNVIFDTLVLGDGLMKIGYHHIPGVSEPQWNAGFASERGARSYTAFGLRMPLFEFLPDYSATDYMMQRFVIHEYDKHIEEVRDMPHYDTKQVRKIKPSRTPESLFDVTIARGEKVKDEFVPIQEVHDLVSGDMLVMAENSGADDFLYRDAEPFGMWPIERLFFFPRPMSVWGKAITQSIEQHMVDLSKLHTYMMSALRKEALLKVLLDAAKWQPEQIKKLESSSDSIISIRGNPEGSYDVMQLGAISKNYAFDIGMMTKKTTIREQAGVGRQQQGMHEPGVRTASESVILQENADVVNKWRSQRFDEFAARVLEKMIFIVSVTYEPARIASMVGLPVELVSAVTDPNGYDPNKFIVEYGDAAVASQEERFQKFIAFFQMFGPVMNPARAMQMAAKLLDFEYDDKMLIEGMTMQGAPNAGGGGGQQGTAGFRPEQSQQQTGGF